VATRALQVVITGDPKGLSRAFDRVDKEASRSEGRMKRYGANLAKGFAVAGAAAGAAALGGLKKAAEAAIESEKSQARLVAQLRASNISFDQHRAQIDRVIQAHSNLSGLDDEDLQDSFTNIVRVTGDVNQALRLNAIAADIARARGLDVAKAGQLVAKVAAGQTSALSRYGVVVEEGATAQEALAAVQQKFAGQAEAYGRTTAGSLDRASVASENLGEVVGTHFTPVLARAATGLVNLVDKAGQLAGPIRRVSGVVGDTARDMIAAIQRFRARNAEDIDAVIQAARNLGRFFRNVFEDVIVPVVRGVLPVIRGVAEGIITAIRGVIRIVTGLINGDWARVWEGFKDIGRGALRAFRSIAGGLIDAMRESVSKVVPAALNAAKAVGSAIVRGIVAGVKAAPGAIADAVKGAVGGALEGVGNFLGVGDGIGHVVRGIGGGLLPPGGGFGGNLNGADADLRPFAALGARFGLAVTPQGGLRPGAITSSGNRSLHATGDAIDMGGPPAGMAAFAKTLLRTSRGRLAELIYTPLGVGVKNGQLTPIPGPIYDQGVASDHYDHVHVGYIGSGDGTGHRRPRTGDGIGEAVAAASRYWQGDDLVTAVAIAGPESGYRNSARLVTDAEDSRGMWQINTKAHPWARGMNLSNPMVAASAAHRVWAQAGGWSPWTAYTGPDGSGSDGPWRNFISRARAAVGGMRGGMAGSGGGVAGGGSPAARNQVQIVRPTSVSGIVAGGPRNMDPGATATSTRGGHAGMPGAWGSPAWFEMAMAQTDLAIAEAGEDPARLAAAQNARRNAVRQRIQKIRRALKGPLRAGTRLRLTQELAQLVGEDQSLSTDINAGAAGPTPAGLATLGIAEATLTPDLGDDLTAAENLLNVRGQELAVARGRGNVDEITQAIDAFRQAGEAVTQLKDAIAAAIPTAFDFNDLAIARASLTDAIDDDIAATEARVALEEERLRQAENTADPRDDIEAIQGLKGARDQLKSFRDAMAQETEERRRQAEIQQRLADELAGFREELKRQNEIHQQVMNVSGREAIRMTADVLAGEFGRGITARVATAGSGISSLPPRQ